MTEIKLTKRYPQSRTEDIVDAYMRGWNNALDAVQNGKFIISDDRKTENCSEKPNNCETCKHNHKEWWELPCDWCCGVHGGYEPQTEPHHSGGVTEMVEPQTIPIKQTWTGSNGERIEYTEAEIVPQTEPQTERSE
jgi:hypothetical protein